MAEYKIVGYVSKAGRLGAYKQTATAKNKFADGNRVLLESFGSEPVKFWVDENKLVAAPAQSATARANAETKHCWDCGCRFTYGDCKENGGDWSDSYCGS